MKQKVKSILENLFNVHREIETSLQCKNLDFSGESILIESLLPRRIFIPNKLLKKTPEVNCLHLCIAILKR